MHKRKRVGKLLLAVVLCVALVGCTKKSPEPEATPTPMQVQETQCATATPGPTEVPYRDLGGMEIIIGDHWTPEELPFIHIPGLEEPLEVYREEIMDEKDGSRLGRNGRGLCGIGAERGADCTCGGVGLPVYCPAFYKGPVL